MTKEESIEVILESIARYVHGGQLGLLQAALDALERVIAATAKE